MKNRTKTYILLVAVLTIWGIIGYRIVSSLKPNDIAMDVRDEQDISGLNLERKQDTFTLKPIDRDPFLGTISSKEVKFLAKASARPRLDSVFIGKIDYVGFINKGSMKNSIFIITIDEEQSLMRIGQKKDDIKLLSGNRSAIRILTNGSTMSIPMNR